MSKQYWSDYWQQGHLTSFGDNKLNNYEGELRDVWQAFFKGYSSGDNILDIGTGNGSIIALALEVNDEHCNYVGIDYANIHINTPKLRNKNNIAFFPNTKAENLPFNDDYFHRITSQFAIEYTDLEKSIGEVSRVLTTNGKFQFTCHHYESSIIKNNLSILTIYEEIVKADGTLDILFELQQSLSISHKQRSETLRLKLNINTDNLITKYGGTIYSTDLPLLVKEIFSTKSDMQKVKILESFRKESISLIARLNALKNAALTTEKLDKLASHCKKLSLKISVEEVLNNHSEILAYKISGSKYCATMIK